jgi:hypothetical protein
MTADGIAEAQAGATAPLSLLVMSALESVADIS